MKKRLTIVKVGGNIIENEQSLQDFTAAFASIKGYKLLVHGGGKVATSMAKTLGVGYQLTEGRRITGDGKIDESEMTDEGLGN